MTTTITAIIESINNVLGFGTEVYYVVAANSATRDPQLRRGKIGAYIPPGWSPIKSACYAVCSGPAPVVGAVNYECVVPVTQVFPQTEDGREQARQLTIQMRQDLIAAAKNNLAWHEQSLARSLEFQALRETKNDPPPSKSRTKSPRNRRAARSSHKKVQKRR